MPEIILPMYTVAAWFQHTEMVEKNCFFLVDIFAAGFPGTRMWNTSLNETQLAALCKNQRYRLSLRSVFTANAFELPEEKDGV